MTFAEVAAGQAFERSRLMSVWFEFAWCDLERAATTWLWFERRASPNEGAFEDSVVRVAEELIKRRLH
ncbi:hypothetical protein [Brevibacterium spongiae]|uniref:Uncharacterized protein n=1 Tax=Brevibacterium spongiae TaxID=2909672 RepID=A0ABY5SKR2_9MICO|nr:hypothetical protein [Brevibacterium spongiae]UVI34724.1 hypothetical protein L1F31_11340 [Brevibacterium spongiae]